MTQTLSGVPQKYKLLLLLSLPVFLLILIIAIQTVNVPYMDQWELVPILQHFHAGRLSTNDFWWQHNEHRIFFPLLLMFGLAVLTHWNTIVECFVSLAVAVTSFALVINVLNRTNKAIPAKIKTIYLLPFLLSLIWFSPVQIENWLWGWQVQWFMNVLGAVGMVWVIAQIKNSTIVWRDLLILLCAGIFAQYSLGNGTLVWPIAIAALLYIRVELKKIILVFITGLVTTALYYRHYVNPSKSSETLVGHHPFSYLYYVITYLGRPLTFFHKLAPVFGLLMLIVFLVVCIYLFVRERKRFDAVLPWVAMGIYAIGTAFMTGIARLSFGEVQALSSRYTTISSLLLVATIVILFSSRDIIKKFMGRNIRLLELLVVAGIFLICVTNIAWGIHSGNIHSRDLKNIRQCTHQQAPTPSCLLSTYPNVQIVTPRLQYLKQIKWGGY